MKFKRILIFTLLISLLAASVLAGGDITSGGLNVTGPLVVDNIDTGNGPLEINSIADQQGDQDLRIADKPTFSGISSIADINVSAKVNSTGFYQNGVSLINDSTGLSALTSAEIDQLENIDANNISSAQWGYLGNQNQLVTNTSSPIFRGLKIYNEGYIYSGSSAAMQFKSAKVLMYKTLDLAGKDLEDFSRDVTVDDNLAVTGTTTLADALTVSSGGADITGNLDVGGSTFMTGNSIINNSIPSRYFIENDNINENAKIVIAGGFFKIFNQVGDDLSGGSEVMRIDDNNLETNFYGTLTTSDALTVSSGGADIAGKTFINQDYDAIGLEIDSEATTSSNYGLSVATGSGARIADFNDGTTDMFFRIRTPDDAVGGSYWFKRNYDSNTTSKPMAYFSQVHAGDDQDAVVMYNAGTGNTEKLQHDGASGTNLYVDTNGGAYAAVFDGGNSGFGEITPDAKVQIFEDLDDLAVSAPSQSDSYQVYINGADGTTGDTVGIAFSTTDANDYVSAAIYAEDTGSAGQADLVLTTKRTTGIAEAARFDDAGNFVMADGNVVIPNGNRLQFKDNGGSPQQILKLDTNNQTYLYSPNGFNLNIDSGNNIKLLDDVDISGDMFIGTDDSASPILNVGYIRTSTADGSSWSANAAANGNVYVVSKVKTGNNIIYQYGEGAESGQTNTYMTVDGGEINIASISGDGSGKAVCIKSDGSLGTCTDAVGAGGTCTCT